MPLSVDIFIINYLRTLSSNYMISIKSMLQLIAFILLDMGSIFLPVCTACKILLDSGYCKFRVFGY